MLPLLSVYISKYLTMNLTHIWLIVLCFGVAKPDIKMVAPYEPGHTGAEPCLRLCVGTTGKGNVIVNDRPSV